MQINDEKYDQKIIAALKALPVPLISFDGHKIFLILIKGKRQFLNTLQRKLTIFILLM